MINDIEQLIQNSAKNIQKSVNLSSNIKQAIESILHCIKNGNKIVLFGNSHNLFSPGQNPQFFSRFRLKNGKFRFQIPSTHFFQFFFSHFGGKTLWKKQFDRVLQIKF